MKVNIKESVLKQIIKEETEILLEQRSNPIEKTIFILGEIYSNSQDSFVKNKIEEAFVFFEKEMKLDSTGLKLKDLFQANNPSVKE